MIILWLTFLAVYGKENVSSGASSDIQHASSVARSMVKVSHPFAVYKGSMAHTCGSDGGTLTRLGLSFTMMMTLQC